MQTDIHGHQADIRGHQADTVRALSAYSGQRTDTVMRRVRRVLGNGYGLDTPLTPEQVRQVFGNIVPKPAEAVQEPMPEPQPEPQKPDDAVVFVEYEAEPETDWRTPMLYLLMAVPAVASIQNIYAVTRDLTDDAWASGLLTVLFTASPFLFVMAGMRSFWTQGLTVVLILYEVFANFTRIYGGLTGFGRAWAFEKSPLSNTWRVIEGPFCTRFLNLVVDIFHTRHDHTAMVMAAIMAGLAAGVFYAAYNELKK
jgi:hypothetical protein